MTKEILFTEEGQMVGIGAHMCAMHEGVGGVLDTLSRMFLAGLRQNERCAYIAPEESVAGVRRSLEEAGVDVADAESGGSLVFITEREQLLKDGAEFDPDYLIEAIKNLFGQTMEVGYTGLRLSADVPWISRDVPGEDRIMEFEAMADEVINNPGVPLLAVCQYRLSELDPEDSLEILERHPLTLVGGQVYVNDKYAS
ncbi:MAG: MEDS domain-containing protein [Actinomycetota bacterium]|jgi:hypothetical protein|nr:MEDS domain-containing protein [Rubrobacter sp.]MDQ3236404.1 MEDS domain-containing protein [Actinomycetota bacterium]